MSTKTYNNFNIVINGERLQDVHISSTDKDFDLEALFNFIASERPQVELQAWATKKESSGLNAMFRNKPADDSAEPEIDF